MILKNKEVRVTGRKRSGIIEAVFQIICYLSGNAPFSGQEMNHIWITRIKNY